MRVLRSFLLFLCLVFFLSPALAADTPPPRGYIPFGDAKKVKPATPQQIDEALKVSEQCSAYPVTATHFDCDCVGMKFLELRQKEGDLINPVNLLTKARLACPNSPAMAGQMYDRCMSWAVKERSDADTFCPCYATTYAKAFGKHPTDSLDAQEAMMTASLGKCDAGRVTQERLERRNVVKRLKDTGLYNLLFPGADELDPKKRSKKPEQDPPPSTP